jgi:hypothetical protein
VDPKLFFSDPRLFMKNTFERRSSKIHKKANLLKSVHFYGFAFVGNRPNLDSNPNPKLITDPDPNLHVISDLSGSTTLILSKIFS